MIVGNTSQAVLFLLGLILFETLADIYAKKWQSSSSAWYYIGSLACYLIANASWLTSLKFGMTLSKGGMIFAVACAVMAVVIGAAFKEPITKLQWLGFFFGLLSMVLIFWSE